MSLRALCLAILPLLLLGCPDAAAPIETPSSVAPVATSEAPAEDGDLVAIEAVFARLQAVQMSRDFASFFNLLSEETQREVLPAAIFGASMSVQAASEAGREQREQELNAILARHGLGPDVTEPEALEQALAAVKKPGALYNQLMHFVLLYGSNFVRPEFVRLTQVVIDDEGRSATGTAHSRVANTGLESQHRESSEELRFLKQGGSWRLHLVAGEGR